MWKQVHFLFYSRLEKEKGIDLVLSVIKRLAKEWEDRCRFSFFSDWSYRKELELCIMETKSFQVSYYGMQPKWDVFTFMKREKVDIVLMPSLFLETFGLNSGEALRHGIPVLGFNKGWTQQFLLDEYCSIDNYKGLTHEERLFVAIKYFLEAFDDDMALRYRQLAQQRALRYSRKERKANFSNILSASKSINDINRILIVSDYATKIAWIESHVYEVKDMLNEEGYEASIFGGNLYGGFVRKIGLLATVCNVWEALRLYLEIVRCRPDIIYRNSVHRYLGWLPLWVGTRRKCIHMIMYHDFWLFHPFPSLVYEEDQLHYPVWFEGFFGASKKSRYRRPILWCKYQSLCIIRRILQKCVKIHLVPSDYMVSLVGRFYSKSVVIQVLPNVIA